MSANPEQSNPPTGATEHSLAPSAGSQSVASIIQEAMDVLTAFEPAVGAEGPTMKELVASWEAGKPIMDDAVYDAMQHCWLVLERALVIANGRMRDGGQRR